MQRYPSFLLSAFLFTAPLLAQAQAAPQTIAQGDVQFDEKRDPTADDMEALRRWIRDKRLVTLKEIGGDLSLSGEVRTEFQDASEVRNGVRQRGDGAAAVNAAGDPVRKAQYVWDNEVNLMLDYRTDRSWAAIKVEFDNDMGVRSGTVNNVRLEKGYLGGRFVAGDTFTFDAEIGRRNLFNVFESRVEFASLFDGLLFRLNKAWPSIGDYFFNVGALLVDDKTNHYAYVADMGALQIANLGLNMRYTIIDWYKPYANELTNLRYKYLVGQFLTWYQFYPEWIGKKFIKIYGAGLCNHLAQGVSVTHGQRQNWAWFAGISIGLVKKAHDWAVDFNYQWVQAQAVPEFDCLGVGRGNVGGIGLYTMNINGDPSSGPTDSTTAVGSTNYKGFEIEGLYALTDNVTIMQNFKYSTTLNKTIGPDLRYKQYEVEFIYAF